MDYNVILIEYGKPTHRWIYSDSHQASLQLDRLNVAFEEVNEVYATLVKTGFQESGYSVEDILQNMIIHLD